MYIMNEKGGVEKFINWTKKGGGITKYMYFCQEIVS